MMNMEFERKLTIPKETKEMYPVTPEMEQIAHWIAQILREGEAAVPRVKAQVAQLTARYPLY